MARKSSAAFKAEIMQQNLMKEKKDFLLAQDQKQTGGSNAMTESNLVLLMNRMRSFKRDVFGTDIDTLDFYLYGKLNTQAAIHLSFPYQMSDGGTYRHPHYKTDSTAEYIASQATSNFISAFLPRGLNSFQVEYYKNSPDKKEADKDAIAALAEEATEVLQLYLNQEMHTFMPAITQVIKDYIELGSCTLRLEGIPNLENGNFELKLEHIPFRNCYFYSRVEDEDIFFLYDEELTQEMLALKYGQVQMLGSGTSTGQSAAAGGNAATIYSVQHLYVPVKWLIIQEEWRSMIGSPDTILNKLESSPKGHVRITMYQNKIIGEPIYMPEVLDIFSARNNDRNNSTRQIYGKGAGLQALSAIRSANHFLHILNTAASTTIEPAVLLELGVTLNADSNRDTNRLNMFPSAVNTQSITTQDGAAMAKQGAQILSANAGNTLQVAEEAYKRSVEQMEAAFGAPIFTVADTPNRTATEVIEQSQASSRQFRGGANGFYGQLLEPLVMRIFMHAALSKEKDYLLFPHKYPDATKIQVKITPEVTIYSFEEEQKRQIEKAELGEYLQLRGALAEAMPFQPEEVENIMNKIKKIYW